MKNETPAEIKAKIEAYKRYLDGADAEKARLTDIMSRKSAKSWDQAKKTKMVRRLMRTDQVINEATEAIELLSARLPPQG